MKKYLRILAATFSGAVVFGLLMVLIAYSWRLALWTLGSLIFVMKLWERVDTYQYAPLPKSKAEFIAEIFSVLILLGFSLLLGHSIEWLLNFPAEYFEITLLKGIAFIFFSLLYISVTDQEYHLWSDAVGSVVGLVIYIGCCMAVFCALHGILPLIL